MSDTEFAIEFEPAKPPIELRVRGNNDQMYAGEWARKAIQTDDITLGYREDPVFGYIPAKLTYAELKGHTVIFGSDGKGRRTLPHSMFQQFVEDGYSGLLIDVDGTAVDTTCRQFSEEAFTPLSVTPLQMEHEFEQLIHTPCIVSLRDIPVEKKGQVISDILDYVVRNKTDSTDPFTVVVDDTTTIDKSWFTESRVSNCTDAGISLITAFDGPTVLSEEGQEIVHEFANYFSFNPGKNNIQDGKLIGLEFDAELMDIFQLTSREFMGRLPKKHEEGLSTGLKLTTFDPLPPRREFEL